VEREAGVVAPPQVAEVPMIEAEVVQQMRVLAGLGWGAKRIATELGVARNTVKRYIRDKAIPGVQVHLKQRKLDEGAKAKAVALFDGAPARRAARASTSPHRPTARSTLRRRSSTG